jgi:hypothetical protein
MQLDALLLDLHASPGGSADLLAGTLFLDSLSAPKGQEYLAQEPVGLQKELIGSSRIKGTDLWSLATGS